MIPSGEKKKMLFYIIPDFFIRQSAVATLLQTVWFDGTSILIEPMLEYEIALPTFCPNNFGRIL